MKSIQILGAAQRDLIRGYRSYERQASGVGRYFMDTLYSEIESLGINAGIHPIFLETITGFSPSISLGLSTKK